PTILCVGSIEGRKNQVSLLHAAEKLWNQGYKFRLTLLGLANQETCGPAMEQLQILQDKKRTLEWLGPRTDEELRLQYATSSFTVYPSIAEGFGLPVLESLKNGKPCVCSSQGAIGEISNGGGCLTVEKPTPEALSKAMKTLLTDSELHSTLCNNARNRTFRTWSDYASDILEFHKSLNKSYEKSR
ncbi:MAG: glycosyltransferase, partial [Opitutae bacterium]|nr:glycosyltransferase [Opitutae bacterium]